MYFMQFHPVLAYIPITIYIIIAVPAAGKKYCPNGRTGTQKNGCFCIRFFVRTRMFSSIRDKWR